LPFADVSESCLGSFLKHLFKDRLCRIVFYGIVINIKSQSISIEAFSPRSTHTTSSSKSALPYLPSDIICTI
jgi:hypothetical protein